MGNSQTNNSIIPVFDHDKWRYVQTSISHHKIYGQYYTLENLQSHELIDEYQIGFSHHEDYQCYLNSVIWRLRGSDIVKTLYIKEEHKRELCNKTFKAKIYIQHIKYRLSSIQSVPFPSNLYIAICALDGFHKLYDNLNYFRIEKDMICIDSRSRIKVWLNADLSKNYPSTNQTKGNETQMVKRIIQIVEECTDPETQPEQSLELFFKKRAKKKLGFEEAKIIVSEYARKYNRQIPDNINILQENIDSYESEKNQENESILLPQQKTVQQKELFYSFNPILRQQQNQNNDNKVMPQREIPPQIICSVHSRQKPIFTFQGTKMANQIGHLVLQNSSSVYRPTYTATNSPRIYFNSIDGRTYSNRTPIQQYNNNMYTESRMTVNLQGNLPKQEQLRQNAMNSFRYTENRIYSPQTNITPLYFNRHTTSKQQEFQSTRQIEPHLLNSSSSKKIDDLSQNDNIIENNLHHKLYKKNCVNSRNQFGCPLETGNNLRKVSSAINYNNQKNPLCYYTVQQDHPLDPDIAADLLKMNVML